MKSKRQPGSAPAGVSANAKARYVMIGGFLGAGKTTALGKLAHRLRDEGRRVGLITNDQGRRLVDTALLAAQGFVVEEIAGGCFCCRFNSLLEAAQKLSAATRPDLFLAEPVGSCTDLVATVTYPLRRIYGDAFTIAPLSVLVDPIRALRVLGMEVGGEFSEKVLYIYRKQLQEADLLVINKSDLLDAPRLARLQVALERNYPQAQVLAVSARTGAGLAEWWDRVLTAEQTPRRAMEVDYGVYAEGEARLGWLNATVRLSSTRACDGNAVLQQLAGDIQRRLGGQGAEVAHLKMTLDADASIGDLAVINLVRNDFVPELSQELQDPLRSGQLLVNLRAEAAPEVLRHAVEEALAACRRQHQGLTLQLEHLEHFKPGKPVPTHRMTSPG
jgi:G3E family GTPase